MAGNLDNINEQFISQVKLFPNLYNFKQKDYRDAIKTKNSWEAIATQFDLTVEECKKKWQCLRDSYRAAKKRREKAFKSGAGRTYVPTWPFYEQMMFIDDSALMNS